MHLRGLARLAETSEALAGYHLDRLSDTGRVRDRRGSGYRRFFPAEPPAPDEREAGLLTVLRREAPFEMTLHLLVTGPSPNCQLSEQTGLARSTVTYHLRRLEEADVVTRREDGVYELVDPREVERVLLRWPPPDPLTRCCPELWRTFVEGGAGP